MKSEIVYITELHPNGYLPVDPGVAEKIRHGQRLKVTIEPLDSAATDTDQDKSSRKASEFIDFLKKNAAKGGFQHQGITRDFIHDDQ